MLGYLLFLCLFFTYAYVLDLKIRDLRTKIDQLKN